LDQRKVTVRMKSLASPKLLMGIRSTKFMQNKS
jgi:hypothetical protein